MVCKRTLILCHISEGHLSDLQLNINVGNSWGRQQGMIIMETLLAKMCAYAQVFIRQRTVECFWDVRALRCIWISYSLQIQLQHLPCWRTVYDPGVLKLLLQHCKPRFPLCFSKEKNKSVHDLSSLKCAGCSRCFFVCSSSSFSPQVIMLISV